MGQSISTTQFYLFGKRHCTVTGYTRHRLAKDYGPAQSSATVAVGADGADGFDLSGKVVMITGANSGIGKEVATYAATKKAKVYMLCRNAERAEKARQDILQKSGADDTSVKTLLADVGVLSQVRKVVSDFQSMESKVDCLVCNAGVLLNDRQVTSEGNEVTFASHLLGGSYLLSTLLLPQLKAAGDEARVVFVSSGGMYNTKFPEWAVLSNDTKYDGNMAYAYAKRGQVLLAERYTREHPEVAWVSCHPGWTDTPAVDLAYGSAKKYLEPMRSIWEGAEGICWLMSTARSNLESGSFYLDRRPQRKHISGPFMTDGSFTKNSEAEVDAFMGNLQKVCGL
mmetsp:Transcript_12827/g.19446  ORF Transcript_12827/g.19446 Transcript_12827/m.19446 type:complete len:340 (-) Transcript_12827:136-1155(-)